MPSIKVRTFEQLADWLEQVGDMLGRLELRPALKRVSLYLASSTRLRFHESQDPQGNPWLPLKRPSKKRGGSSAKPLRDTDVLMASMTSGGDGNVERITNNALEWGTNVEYAGFHQDGTRDIPARPFLGVNDTDEERIVQIVMDFLTKDL